MSLSLGSAAIPSVSLRFSSHFCINHIRNGISPLDRFHIQKTLRSQSSSSSRQGRRHRRQPQSSLKPKPAAATTTAKTTSGTVVKQQAARTNAASSSHVNNPQWWSTLFSFRNGAESWSSTLIRWIVPVRYRFSRNNHKNIINSSSSSSSSSSNIYSNHYQYDQGVVILCYRLPLFVGLAALFIIWDETAPLTLIRIHGPSMVPTMAADGTDIWLCRRYRYNLGHWFEWPGKFPRTMPPLKRGDLIGFAPPPDHCSSSNISNHASADDSMVARDPPPTTVGISCKRIVGLPGDVIQRYGQYVSLYTTTTNKSGQDTVIALSSTAVGVAPTNRCVDPQQQQQQQQQQQRVVWGMVWPTDAAHAWIDPTCPWDHVAHKKETATATLLDPYRTITVPPGHVWVEADCPILGIDSRHMGPIPHEWIRGKVVARLWPLSRTTAAAALSTSSQPTSRSSWRQRPHPIPLDPETLMEYNMFRSVGN